jgi:hypothetical protein
MAKGTNMNRTRRLIGIVLFCAAVVMLLSSALRAESPKELRQLSAQEIEKIAAALPSKAVVEAKPRKMLVFWRCEGFFHGSIPVVNKALEMMGKKTGVYEVVITDDYSVFTPEKLKEFDAVCLNNTTGMKFDPKETPERCKALLDFVKSGKGIVGVHAATDNFKQWPEGEEMMGGKFTGHPWGGGDTVAIKIDQPNHPLMAPFKGKGFKVKEEIYRTEPPLYSRSKQLVLMSLDMSDPATKAKASKPSDEDTGISWVKNVGEGRVFYCSLGHNDEIFMNEAILRHYLAGIQFAFGDYKVDTKPKP